MLKVNSDVLTREEIITKLLDKYHIVSEEGIEVQSIVKSPLYGYGVVRRCILGRLSLKVDFLGQGKGVREDKHLYKLGLSDLANDYIHEEIDQKNEKVQIGEKYQTKIIELSEVEIVKNYIFKLIPTLNGTSLFLNLTMREKIKICKEFKDLLGAEIGKLFNSIDVFTEGEALCIAPHFKEDFNVADMQQVLADMRHCFIYILFDWFKSKGYTDLDVLVKTKPVGTL